MSTNPRFLTPLQGLPALARAGSSRAARRYRREHETAVVSLPRGPRRTRRSVDGRTVRTFRVSALRRPSRRLGSEAEVVPSLRLSGRWLDELGFGIGMRVSVEIEDGRLVLKREGCFEE